MNTLPLKLAFCALSVAAAQPAMAQMPLTPNLPTQTNVDRLGQTDVQARISLTIPFGRRRSDPNSQSKLSLGLRSETRNRLNSSFVDMDWMMRAPEVKDVNFALTLENSPKFLINDHVIYAPETQHADAPIDQKNGALDTYDKTVLTVIGVSLVVIAGTIIAVAE